jgi:hypothetical protein
MSAHRLMVLPVAVAAAAIGATAAAHARAAPAVKVSSQIPSVIRQKDRLALTGRVNRAPRHVRVALELARLQTPKTWTIAAQTTAARHGSFTIHWRVPTSENPGPVTMRVVAMNRRGAPLAASKPVQSAIGPPYIACSPPVPPAVAIPEGDGWIVGGAYGIGGAFPGVDECISEQYTVTATNSSGQVAATEAVQGGHSYTLAPLPAGSYTLQADACRGTATVTAGKQTSADADCLYP